MTVAYSEVMAEATVQDLLSSLLKDPRSSQRLLDTAPCPSPARWLGLNQPCAAAQGESDQPEEPGGLSCLHIRPVIHF